MCIVNIFSAIKNDNQGTQRLNYENWINKLYSLMKTVTIQQNVRKKRFTII